TERARPRASDFELLIDELILLKSPSMLREPQHERKNINAINIVSVRSELDRRVNNGFLAESEFTPVLR
ncbi:MAG TPA: hypothetical protein VFM35_12160, partial [Candidatus Binatia bacterium]|nr:hypothetical protein [Candidatus Binatia bacterium]